MLKLRGHHLICLHFFRGEGYSAEFIGNLEEILKKAEADEQITVLSDADDFCDMCPYLKGAKCFYEREADQEIRRMDGKALNLLELIVGDIILWTAVKEKLPLVFNRWADEFCNACDWRWACEKNTLFGQLFHEKT